MIQRIMLIADEGKILTNGEFYGRTLYLAEGSDATAYHEISEAEYAAKLETEKKNAMAKIG